MGVHGVSQEVLKISQQKYTKAIINLILSQINRG